MRQQGCHLLRPPPADEAVVPAVHDDGSLVDVRQPFLDPVGQRRAGHGVEAGRPAARGLAEGQRHQPRRFLRAGAQRPEDLLRARRAWPVRSSGR